jgi:hypothetical protein
VANRGVRSSPRVAVRGVDHGKTLGNGGELLPSPVLHKEERKNREKEGLVKIRL